MQETANWLRDQLKESRFKTKIYRGYGNPVVFGHYQVSPKAPIYLIYGHYDVQPASHEDGWKSDPFTLAERGSRFYARGVADNKGQILIHLRAAFELIKTKKLAYNLKFLIEGNEETGSGNLRQLLVDYKKDLAADCVIISDGDIPNSAPAIEASFRGTFNVELTLTTSSKDLHSGLFGGTVPNAAQVLIDLLATLRTKEGEVAINQFAENLPEVSVNITSHFERRLYCDLTGCREVFVNSAEELMRKTGLQSAIEITGFKTGYTGEGFRNSIPAVASAKINVRLAPGQKPDDLIRYFRSHLLKNVPSYATLNISITEGVAGVLLDTNNPHAVRAKNILTEVYGVSPIAKYSGGTLPIVRDFQEVLKISQVMIPLANEDCGMHAANENFKIANVKKGLAFSKSFFS